MNESIWLWLGTGARLVNTGIHLLIYYYYFFYFILQWLLKKSSTPRVLLQFQLGYALRFPTETAFLPGFGTLLVYHRLRFTPLVRVGIRGGVGGGITATRAVVVPSVPQGPVMRRLGSAARTDTSVSFIRFSMIPNTQLQSDNTQRATLSTRIQYSSRDTYIKSHLPHFLHLNQVCYPVSLSTSNSSFITRSFIHHAVV